MGIVIEFNGVYTESFIKWLVSKIRESLIIKVNEKRLIVMSEYMYEAFDLEIDLCDAFISILNNINYFKTKSCYHIEINRVRRFKSTGIRLIELAKFINYGNMDIGGTYVFSDVFNTVMSNINEYYNLYLMEEGVL